ncbi:uncharacterized protein F5891DRAFT_1004896 [Suillus fuscotomentosus]|uniref:Uncharacterized protein n=1 Tax=Suillus fuscotomentosus TaxID=1912939 RepID=A0AAD4EHQ8_9AGAM|nr:uncharacterized protein F5891DRAFT_1004896 [Suillus fuscotomentosus]KAG1906286.1 hypothetical protein F5891DRAFT_1004896 [Suillus fuscotomentosus]
MFSDAPGSPTPANLADIFIEANTKLDAIDFGKCGEALKFIMEPNPEEEYAEFFDVSRKVYPTVSHIIDLNWIWLPARPRWSYFEDDRILLIEMRSRMHEAPIQHFESIFGHFLGGFVRRPVLTITTMNSRLTSTDTVPDIAMQIVIQNTRYWIRKPLVIVECAFAQDTDSVLRKIKHEIAGQPEVLMVILVVIDEHQPYRSPERMSEAWQMLSQETSCRSDSSFASLEGDASRSYNHRVVIAGHTWCHLGSVRFHVWVRGNEPINIDDDDDELHACGTLLPNRDMDAVDTMIENGMVMMRDSIAIVCQEAALGSDITIIQDTVVAFSPDWDGLLMQLNFEVAETAYDRYHSWYNSSP